MCNQHSEFARGSIQSLQEAAYSCLTNDSEGKENKNYDLLHNAGLVHIPQSPQAWYGQMFDIWIWTLPSASFLETQKVSTAESECQEGLVAQPELIYQLLYHFSDGTIPGHSRAKNVLQGPNKV